jgi:hypothetical protein
MPQKPSALPAPELLDRIKREIAAPRFLADLTLWADRQCGRQLSIEGRCEHDKASDLVNAALVATMDGTRRWDPAARSLRRHCELTINSYLWHEYEKLRRRRHITLDTASVDDSQDEAPSLDIEMSLRREDMRMRPDGLMAQREVRAEVFHALRAHARKNDVGMRSFLDCYEAGHSREGEVVERLGLTDKQFRAVLFRFYRLREEIPNDLRRDALETMIQDGGPPIATVARRSGRLVEIAPDESGGRAANDSDDALVALDPSSDGSSGDGEDGGGEQNVA